jgi:hypothetical protein
MPSTPLTCATKSRLPRCLEKETKLPLLHCLYYTDPCSNIDRFIKISYAARVLPASPRAFSSPASTRVFLAVSALEGTWASVGFVCKPGSVCGLLGLFLSVYIDCCFTFSDYWWVCPRVIGVLCAANDVLDNRERICFLRLYCFCYSVFTILSLLHCADVMPKDGAESDTKLLKGVRPPPVGSLNLKPILGDESARDTRERERESEREREREREREHMEQERLQQTCWCVCWCVGAHVSQPTQPGALERAAKAGDKEEKSKETWSLSPSSREKSQEPHEPHRVRCLCQ